MTTANEQQMSHADRHDRDKLERWKADLDGSADAGIPYCAIFLVSGEDRASHDIFRRYRSAFEEMGGGFHNLVIFGQHGVSTTQVAFARELGLDTSNVPVLAIAKVSDVAETVHCVALPKGDPDGELDETQTWGTVLGSICAAVSAGSNASLDGLNGVERRGFRSGALATTIESVLEGLG